jgi:hypothetical protein
VGLQRQSGKREPFWPGMPHYIRLWFLILCAVATAIIQWVVLHGVRLFVSKIAPENTLPTFEPMLSVQSMSSTWWLQHCGKREPFWPGMPHIRLVFPAVAVFLRKEMGCAAAGRFSPRRRASCIASSSYVAEFCAGHYNSRVKSTWLGGLQQPCDGRVPFVDWKPRSAVVSCAGEWTHGRQQGEHHIER